MNKDIYNAIKSNNINLFEDCVNKEKSAFSLRFGRFPLLSLCYLYNAKKILKWYEKKLNVSTYVYAAEDAQMFNDFKQKANKCVRLFTLEGAIVSPLEMLAALNSPKMKKAYPILRKTDSICENVLKIYQMFHGQNVTTANNEIVFPRAQLTPLKKRLIAAAVAVALIFSALPLVSWAIVKNSLGSGTQSSPYMVSNIRQLEEMFEKNDLHFALKNNLTLPSSFEPKDFSGTLDGRGATITLSSPMFNALSGTLKNVNFVIDCDESLSQNTAFVALTNSGTMDNLTANISGQITLSGTNEIEFAAFAHTNYGTIKNCKLSIGAEFLTDEGSGGLFGGFAFYNDFNAQIENCTVLENSFITANTVDLAGIAAFNYGIINGCTNNASLSLTTQNVNWFALAAGVSFENYGTISNSFNNGNIAVSLLSQTQNDLQVRTGGIVYANLATIEKCKNTANITVVSGSFSTYAGGIAGFNWAGKISACGSSGKISVIASTSNVNVFAGGIAGYNGYTIGYWGQTVDFWGNAVVDWGKIQNSFSAMEFDCSVYGGIAGLWYAFNANQFEGNLYLNADFGIAEHFIEGETTPLSEELLGNTRLLTLSELQSSEVYW